jgi:hypothetical protein
MYQQKCPIYRNSKAVRDMVLLLMARVIPTSWATRCSYSLIQIIRGGELSTTVTLAIEGVFVATLTTQEAEEAPVDGT